MPRPPTIRKAFEPALALGDVCMLLGGSDFKKESGDYLPFYEVTMVEAVPVLGVHGATVIWTQSAPPPSPYVLDPQGVSGTIAAGASAAATPKALVLNRKQLLQFRTLIKPIGTVIGALEDYDFTVSMGGATRWTLLNAQGVLNAMVQSQVPADAIALPAQGANATLPAAFPAVDPFDAAWRSELWTYEDQSPTFSIKNNGANPTSGTFAFALVIAGWLYNLNPLSKSDYPTTTTVPKLGYSVPFPAGVSPIDVPIIPVSARQPY